MNLKEYANKINKLAKKCPNIKVVYSSDEEGNSFSEVFFAPTLGIFNGESFDSLENSSENEPNAVCVN